LKKKKQKNFTLARSAAGAPSATDATYVVSSTCEAIRSYARDLVFLLVPFLLTGCLADLDRAARHTHDKPVTARLTLHLVAVTSHSIDVSGVPEGKLPNDLLPRLLFTSVAGQPGVYRWEFGAVLPGLRSNVCYFNLPNPCLGVAFYGPHGFEPSLDLDHASIPAYVAKIAASEVQIADWFDAARPAEAPFETTIQFRSDSQDAAWPDVKYDAPWRPRGST
jgi:hypothetical protein